MKERCAARSSSDIDKPANETTPSCNGLDDGASFLAAGRFIVPSLLRIRLSRGRATEMRLIVSRPR